MMQAKLSGFVNVAHFWGLAHKIIETHVSLIMSIIPASSHLALLADKRT